MSLSAEYKRQYDWRPWPKIFEALPPFRGQTILDLGCGVGDQAAELVARGARVIGVDMNEDLLLEARSRKIHGAEFLMCDLRTCPDLGVTVDGLWCSFAAAYFPDLHVPFTSWAGHLRPGGWVALTEIDDLFGHKPLSERTRALLDSYTRESIAAGRYDSHMGRKLPEYLVQAGFTVQKTLTLEDQELSFDGPARVEVVDAWGLRFDRLKLLRDLCGADFKSVREEFLDCLKSANHRSSAKVYCCIGTK
jgi:ubiquinone/menaquinone biosynthesis C-methylase UbiE